MPLHQLIRHICSRWLTLGSACERVLEQLPGLNEFFFNTLPKDDVATTKRINYVEIVTYLKDPILKPTLQFVVFASKIFTENFTLLMQKEEPLIHILHPQLRKVLLIMITNVTKSDRVPDELFTIDSDKLLVKQNLKDLECINNGQSVAESIKELNSTHRTKFLTGTQLFYIASIHHLLKKVENLEILMHFQCISPENIRKKTSHDSIITLAKSLPLYNVDLEILSIEWRLLQFDTDISFHLRRKERIDTYWNKIFELRTGETPRYTNTTRVIKAALSLVHGSADVERGFSKSGNILSSDKTRMTLRTLNAKISVSEGLKDYDCKVWEVPMTAELTKLGRQANASYTAYLAEEKRKKEEKELQTKVDLRKKQESDSLIANVKKELKSVKQLEKEYEVARKMYDEAVADSDVIEKMLRDAILKNSSKEITQQIARSCENIRNLEKNIRIEMDSLNENIRKSKTAICDGVANKKLKLS
ncbi:hypothetical protein QAD02_019824 [Eretmocerus hayati]|uniref:Uncharacterized protein n=1 Tax=Eretmocerus hayati TaxID=131215 RepID=A0ACC2PKP8_9HYME|nr:hypothetical protein QAD02_019824 [Eretmocerus hayati]